MDETRQLAAFVAETHYGDLPPDLIERARVYVLDNLAAGFVGSVQPWSRLVVNLMRELGGNGGSSIFNQAWQTDVSRATLLNGVMMGAFEAEHIGHVAHPSATVFPAALAIAERDRCPGQAFLAALLLGYEVVCRIGEAQTRATEVEHGFHNPGVNGAFGAATAVGRLRGLDAARLASALGVAGSHACGLIEFVWEGAMTKRAHPGRAAQLGLESALLAELGFSGPTTVLEGRYGYLQAYSPKPHPARLLSGLGTEWLAADLTVKAYPCHVTAQAVVHALQRSKREEAIEPHAIRRVVVRVDPRAAEARHLDQAPTTLLGAQYSLPFTVAIALTRDLSNPFTLDETVLADPAIRDLARRTEVRPRQEQAGGSRPMAEVMLEMDDGSRILQVEGFPGSHDEPLDFDGAVEKLYRYAAPLVGDRRVGKLVDQVRGLEELADVGALAELIRA